MPSRAAANFSNSSSDDDPSSLQGSRCSASSITPSVRTQDKAAPPRRLTCVAPDFPSATLMSFLISNTFSPQLNRLLHPVHLLDLILHPPRIHRIQRALHMLSRYAPGHNRRQISALVPHHHHLLRFRQTLRNRALDRFRRNLVP